MLPAAWHWEAPSVHRGCKDLSVQSRREGRKEWQGVGGKGRRLVGEDRMVGRGEKGRGGEGRGEEHLSPLPQSLLR